MKRYILIIITLLFVVSFLSGCGTSPNKEGDIRFNLDLFYPKQMGYQVTSVHVTLTHQTEGMVVEDDLYVDTVNERASGTISNIRIGTWDLFVELFENGSLIGNLDGPQDAVIKKSAHVVGQQIDEAPYQENGT